MTEALSKWERRVLERFVEVCFGGDESLRSQINATSVSRRETTPDSIYVQFHVPERDRSTGVFESPADLASCDLDGTPIELMLFVSGGRLAALEGFLVDANRIQQLPSQRHSRRRSYTGPEGFATGVTKVKPTGFAMDSAPRCRVD
jgi:hypothetical protein